jgi:hypothetical protein
MKSTQATEFHRSLTQAFESSMRNPMSRRAVMRTSAAVAAGGALAMTMSGPALFGLQSAMAQAFTSDVDVLNYALTLEHLEATFYRTNNEKYSAADFGDAGFGSAVRGRFDSIEAHEVAHVDTLTKVITSLGGTPVAEAMYDFGVTDVKSYVATAQVLENLGTGAYTGAAQFLIDNDDLLTAALTIHGVEARHASYLNNINGQTPFPEAFETPLSPADVLAAATPLIVSGMPNTGSGSTAVDSSRMGGSSMLLAAAGAATVGAVALTTLARSAEKADREI